MSRSACLPGSSEPTRSCPPDRGGGVDRGRRQGLGRGQAQVAAGQGDDKLHAFTPGRPGVEIAAQSPAARLLPGWPAPGCNAARASPKGVQGSATATVCCRRQGADILGRGFHQVVGGDGPQPGSQPGSAQVVEFVGVDFEGEAQLAGGRQGSRRDCSRLKAPVSQNTSTKGRRPPVRGHAACHQSRRAGSISAQTSSV